MSTDPDSPDGTPVADEAAEADTLAEVLRRFTFGGRRRTMRYKHLQRSPKHAEHTDPGLARWPTHEPPEVESRPAVPVPDTHVEPELEEAATYIRPYAWTGGRTKSNHRFELETLISTSELAQTSRLERLEHHSIAGLCRHPRSVAEVGAVLGVPLGVARVLLGDMADLGLITVHRTVTENGSTSHLMLMERVLSGLRRL